MWNICLYISVACVVVFAVLPLIVNGRNGKKRRLKWFYSLGAGVLTAQAAAFFPVHSATAEAGFLGTLRTALLSLYTAMQSFTIGTEFSSVLDSAAFCPENLFTLYQLWIAALIVTAPFFTAGFVLSFFKNASAYMRYWLCYRRNVYVFSELNERSLALASDMKHNHKDALIVFTDVFEKNEEKSYELGERAEELGAVCFKKDILAVRFKHHSAARRIEFFAIGNDETENLHQALQLVDKYKNRPNTRLYVFSANVESELLLSTLDTGKIRLRRINEAQSLINRILYNSGDIFFQSARPAEDGVKEISAVVVGLGRHGTEMVKALSWFCQMDGYRVQINGFDKDAQAEEKIMARAPALLSPEYNGQYIAGEAQYCIRIHPSVEAGTATFAETIQSVSHATYVLVALGDDETNIKTAVELRMLFERIGIHPVIQAILYNAHQKNALCGIRNFKGQAYDIDFIGDTASSYVESVIIDSELEADALARHLADGRPEEDFWKYEYNYRSSVASAIHMRARTRCGIPGTDKNGGELTAEESRAIAELEHRRWNAYMRAEGYIAAEKRNDLGKMHPDLVSYAGLSREHQQIDIRIGTK